jgi:hypothetical protein
LAKSDKGQARRNKDKERASFMKRLGIARTTGRCAQCYAIISIDSWKSRYTHKCKG